VFLHGGITNSSSEPLPSKPDASLALLSMQRYPSITCAST